MEYTKISDTELEVIKPAVATETKTKYSFDFLKNQELAILKSINDFVEVRKLELTEVRELILKAEEFGLKTMAELAEEKLAEEIAKENLTAEEIIK